MRVVGIRIAILAASLMTVCAADFNLQDFLAKVPPLVPDGRTLRVVGSYSSSSNSGKIQQSCDNVVCYFSSGNRNAFWVSFNEMSSTSADNPNKRSTFSTSLYCDGDYLLRITTWGKGVKAEAPSQVEISNFSEKLLPFRPFAVGLGFTMPSLLSPNNRILGEYLLAKEGATTSIQQIGPNTELIATFKSSNDEVSAEVNCKVQMSGDNLSLVSLEKQQIVSTKDSSQTIEESIKVTETEALAGYPNYSFPKSATYRKAFDGKEDTTYVFKCKEVAIIDEFPDPPSIPPLSDVVDKRLGISVRTGNAPSRVTEQIKDYLEKR